MNDLEQRVKILEQKVKVLEETLETIKNMKLSEEMNNYINSKTKTLKVMSLLNSMDDELKLDFKVERDSVHMIQNQKEEIDRKIVQALKETDNSYSQLQAYSQYFDYEEETGMITGKWHEEKKEQCHWLKKYIGKGIRITGYNGFETEKIVIPKEINGRPVITIGEKVFMNTNVSEILLPQSLKCILRNAFYGCKQLTNINLPNELIYIGSESFAKSGLKEFLCSDSVQMIENSAFESCKDLKKVYLGKDLCRLKYSTFYNCINLSYITLPESVLEIEHNCFHNTALSEIVIPANVTTISNEMFGSSTWYITSESKNKITFAFLGEDTDILFENSYDKKLHRVGLIYCLSGSKIQKRAREENIPIKPLSEFRMEDYL